MAEETIPLVFQAQDELTRQVAAMVEALQKLASTHDDTTEKAEEADKAEKSLADTLSEVADATAIAERATQLAGAAWAAAGFVYEKLSEGITASLAAWDEQSKKSGKSASALGSVTESSAKLEKTITKLLAQLGKMIERSGSIQVTYAILGGVLDEVRKILKEVEGQAKDTVGSLGGDLADGASGFFGVVRDNSATLAEFVVGLGLLDDAAKGVWVTFKAFINLLRIGLYQTLETGAEALGKLLTGLERMSAATGVALPEGVREARVALDGLSFGANKLANEGIADLVDNIEDLGKTSAKIVDEVLSLGSVEATINRLADAGEKAAKKAKGALDRGGERGRGDLVSPEDAAAEARAAALLDLDRQILLARQSKNEALVIELERERELAALGQRLKEIKTSTLRDATQSAESLRIQLDYEQKLKDLEQTRRDDRRAAAEEETALERELLEFEEQRGTEQEERARRALEAIAARREAEIERIDAVAEAATSGFEGLADLVGEMDDATARLVDSLERGFGAAAQLGANLAKLSVSNKSFKDSQEEVSAAMSAGVGLASALIGAFESNIKKRAAWEAALNAAAAIAAGAFAISGYPGFAGAAIGHAAAAVKFGLIAGGAIGGGGGGGGASSGGGGAAGPTLQSPDLSRERELNAEAIASAIAEQGRGGATIITIDFGSSMILGQTPEAARQIVDAIAPELQRMTG